MIDLKTKLYWFLQGPYKPAAFWEKWGNTFINETTQRSLYPQHPWILKKLFEQRPKNLLEVGCGFGRNIKYIAKNYPYPLAITGVDFSEPMLEYAHTYLASLSAKTTLPTLQQADVLDLPFITASFDVVLSHGVLMHIKPNNIYKAIKELLRVTKKELIIVEQNGIIKPLHNKPYQKINYFTYAYPYKKLFIAHGVKVKEYHKRGQLDWLLINGIRKSKKL